MAGCLRHDATTAGRDRRRSGSHRRHWLQWADDGLRAHRRSGTATAHPASSGPTRVPRRRPSAWLSCAVPAASIARLGHPASPAYSAPKILWVRDEQPEIYEQAICFLQPKDYLVYKLTGSLATDYSDASGTLLFDLEARTWDPGFLEALGSAGRDPSRSSRIHGRGRRGDARGRGRHRPCRGHTGGHRRRRRLMRRRRRGCNRTGRRLLQSRLVGLDQRSQRRAHSRSQRTHDHLPPCTPAALRAHGNHVGRRGSTSMGLGTAGPGGCRSGPGDFRNRAWSRRSGLPALSVG